LVALQSQKNYLRKYKEKHPERFKAIQKRYIEKNKGHWANILKQWKAEHPEKQKGYLRKIKSSVRLANTA